MNRIIIALICLCLAVTANAQTRFLREDTASQARSIGPFLDPADGTAEGGLTVSAADVRLKMDGGADAAKNSGDCTHDVNGMYDCTFDATDTANSGDLNVTVCETGAVCVSEDFIVLETNVYDILFPDAAALGTRIPDAVAGAAGGLLIAGDNADFNVTANAAFAGGITITQSSSNTPGLAVTGNGSGAGILATGGTSGDGFSGVGGGTSGDGMQLTATAGNGSGLRVVGNGTGQGAIISSGSGATGDGVAINSLATNGSALVLSGAGTGSGLLATGGATGDGIEGVGGGTSGAGFRVAGTAGNSPGATLVGQGSAAGALFTGGATGAGVSYVGGATSGNGIQVTITAPLGAVPQLGIRESGTMQAGSTGTTAVLRAATDFSADDRIEGSTIEIIAGTGAGASLGVASYVNATDTATMDGTWPTTPDNTSQYIVWATAPGSGGDGGDGSGFTDIPWNSDWDVEAESEVTDALAAIFLDQLLAATYNPAAEPAADSLFGDLTESDAGVTRFTTNSLEQAPTGSGESSAAIAEAVWEYLVASCSAEAGSLCELITLIEGQTDDIGAAGAGLTSRASQTSVDDLPTNAELATSQGTADDATLAAIAALNNLSSANVQTLLDAGVFSLGYVTAGGDVCTLIVSEMEPHLTLDCTEAP